MKTIKFILPVALIMVTAFILLFQPEIFTTPLYDTEKMPTGTLISWIGLVAFAWVFYLIRPIRKRPLSPIYRDLLYLNFFAAVFWGFFSYLLAGNWQFNFAHQLNFYIWAFYTASVLLVPLTVYVIWFLKRREKY